MITRTRTLTAMFSLVPLSGLTVRADMLSWTVNTGYSADMGSGVEGTEFTPQVNITVTALGYYDDILLSANGLDAPHPVAIYRVSDQQLITSTTVPSGTVAPKTNQFRFQAITPVVLSAGVTYVVAADTDGDWGRNVTPGGSMLVSPYISIGPWRTGGANLSFPVTVISASARFVGPAFTFQAVLGDLPWTTVYEPVAQTSTGVDGTELTPNTNILVTGLGFYDDRYSTADGLSASHQVGIYNVATQALVASGMVPAGTSTAKSNEFRFVALSDPVMLQACTTYVVAGVINGDPMRVGLPGDDMLVHPDITLGAWRTGGGSSLSFPPFVVPAETRSLSATFAFQSLPGFPDADRDHVRDCVDACPNTLACTAVDASGCASPRKPGDADGDGDVDLADFDAFRACARGAGVPLAPGCTAADVDGDHDVDLDDFGALQRCFSGPGVCTDPACAG